MQQQPTNPPVTDTPVDGLSRFLWWLAAADADILKDCKADKERYRIVGIAVLVTWMFATLAWGYFFSTVLNDDMIVAALALFFGFAILSIDRSLIAAMSRNQSGNKFVPVAFRLLLAVTIGLFISQPVVLMLFQKDIQAQIVLNKQTKLDTFRKELGELNAARKSEIQGGLDGLNAEVRTKEEQVKDYKDAYIRETDGTGGSGRIGESAIARVKKSEYLKAEEDLIKLRKANAPKILEREAQLQQLVKEDSVKEQAYIITLTDGFLAQTEALTDLTEKHPPLKQRYRLVVFLITLIEVMPLLTKLLMPKGEYDEKLAAITAQSISDAQLGLEKGKVLQHHYHDIATAADQETMDQLFELTRDARRQHARDLVEEWKEQDGKRYPALWTRARKMLMLHRTW
ncbi:DUF4407 domain-containing protein [Chitinophaga horti]|uniref:DUF4407 domain-containing protein n=1 Tax=Chitinophaga horti TaxID=2920382 RepID=A0ABY6J4M0_9BACT|nr:DUF4407 domain-containing protein [Chitinophaga horti]UYQ94620.1 DUF4407 domain-containing protein [Chitinophaga horti]